MSAFMGMPFIKFAIFLVLLLLASATHSASPLQLHVAQGKDSPGKTLTMCIDHYPPLQVVLEDGQATGENVEIARQFTNNLGYGLRFTTDIPFKRCLQWMKDGLVDIMAGLLESEERRRDYHMFLYDDYTVKTFFVRENTIGINSFADLEGLNIAVVRGSRQFQEFDNAPDSFFNRVYVNTLPAAFGMLARGRVDAVVCTDYYGDNVIKSHPSFIGKLVRTQYSVINGTKVFIAVSRQSKLNLDITAFEQMAQQMYDSGTFKQIVREFQANNPQYY